MIEIVGLNNSMEKSRFFISEKEKNLKEILRGMDRINDMYNTKNSKSITNKLESLNKESRNISSNNQKYTQIFKETIKSYNVSMKEYSKNFETLGDI